jgi:hypothetical protein
MRMLNGTRGEEDRVGRVQKKVVRPRLRGWYWWSFVSLEHVQSLAACSGCIVIGLVAKKVHIVGIKLAAHAIQTQKGNC